MTRSMGQGWATWLVVIGIGLGAAVPASADAPSPERGYELQHAEWWFLSLETLGAVVVFAGYSIAAGDPPTACSWCESNGFDEAMRDTFVMNDRIAPATFSHILSLGIVPLGAFAALLVPAIA